MMNTTTIPRPSALLLSILTSCASVPPPPPPGPSAPEPATSPSCVGLSKDQREIDPCAVDDILSVEALPVQTRAGDTLTGARMVFRSAPGRTAESLKQAIDCHIAGTQSRDPRQQSPLVSYCPLAIANVTAVVHAVSGGLAVDVRPRDATVSRRISHTVVHGRQALALERFESAACQGIEPKGRAACPLLGPVAAVVDLPEGVRVEFPNGVPVDPILARMRCHYSFAQAHGFSEEATACPLYMRGLRLERSPDGKSIDISVSPATMVSEIRRNVRDEVVFAGGAPAQPVPR